ncbi:archaellin/type IV pilin N-terminal domain-containing protein [Haloarcula sp. JP-L23]|uniref:DUF7289 family protein n=1 Tax=Haloarcula sp. JP-L23 TaxID=2716717 RepID=UPI00140ED193|nr:hypothetical protein G9465_06935 [Haloarcula sp. JP-L23]
MSDWRSGNGLPDEFHAEKRGQSELVGVILLVAIVILASTLLVVTGSPMLADGKKVIEVTQTEHALRQLDAETSDVAFGSGTDKSHRLNLGISGQGGQLYTENNSWMRVHLVNASTGTVDAVAANESLGTVRYVQAGTTVGYEGGGVWRHEDGGSVMISRPEFHFREKTLTLPIVVIDGDPALTSYVQVAANGPPQRRFPNTSAGLTNRIRGQKVAVTVHSEYYEAWGRYFRETTNGYIRVDHDARTATVIFPSKGTGPSAFPSGVVATSGSGFLEFAGQGAYSDSYSSADGPYTAPGDRNGTVVAAGDVRTTGNSTVYGDIWSGSTVTLDGETNVSGDIHWTEDYEQNGAAVSGTDRNISGIASIEPVDFFVRDRVASIRASNNNANTTNITDNEISISDDGGGGLPTGTLTAGSYYLETMNLSGERLVLDTTDGNISIAVRDYILMERGGQGNPGSNITVKGDGVVRLYVASERKILIEKSGHNNLDRDRHLSFYQSIDSEVHVPGNRAPQLRVFGPREFTFAMAGSSSKPTYFNGYIYAPAGLDGAGSAYLKQGELYGGVVTGNLTIGQNAAVHYDMALSQRTIPESPGVSRIEFMHVGVRRVNVTAT